MGERWVGPPEVERTTFVCAIAFEATSRHATDRITRSTSETSETIARLLRAVSFRGRLVVFVLAQVSISERDDVVACSASGRLLV